MSACAKPASSRPRAVIRPAAELCALAALLAGLAALAPAHWRPATAPVAHPAASHPAHVLSLAAIRADPRFQNALWLDARSPADHAAGHVPGALRFTEPEWETHLPALLDRWEPGVPVIVYCDSAACGASARIAARLRRELADENIYALEGGWPAWSPAP